jgi:tetratricopeptide (TPR) repeat protein
MVLALALALGLGRIPRGRLRPAAAILALAAALACASQARAQLETWRNSDSVFLRIINGTWNASVRKENLSKWAKASADLGRFETTRAILAEWAREYPGSAPAFSPRAAGAPLFEAAAHLKIAIEAARAERTTEAAAHFRRSLAIDPSYEDAQYNFAMFLGLHGEPREALHLYFILSGGRDRPGPQPESALLSVIARAFWDRGEKAQARDAVALALARAREGGGAPGALLVQAREYGAQTLPALRDSTIR